MNYKRKGKRDCLFSKLKPTLRHFQPVERQWILKNVNRNLKNFKSQMSTRTCLSTNEYAWTLFLGWYLLFCQCLWILQHFPIWQWDESLIINWLINKDLQFLLNLQNFLSWITLDKVSCLVTLNSDVHSLWKYYSTNKSKSRKTR